MVFARRDFLHLTLGAAASASVSSAALAFGFPTRPVTIIVPFAAGGPADITARIVGEQLAKRLADDSSRDIGRPAGRKRNDDSDGTRRKTER